MDVKDYATVIALIAGPVIAVLITFGFSAGTVNMKPSSDCSLFLWPIDDPFQ